MWLYREIFAEICHEGCSEVGYAGTEDAYPGGESMIWEGCLIGVVVLENPKRQRYA